ncbi:Leucine-rich repeat protein SHOC-2 [Strongyloides ratti]|uniref:Leucine-rich repeat protein SHOC-2 n=1 Tax=Strongyloides ratti TaxID=34506 RepID=A0A090N0T6_STRRB|nr:Leucine-rich repeat protein SHOC-2 [Strongyloides ratti]CEF71253.1 Leucine-rich repeat protein SHOC-2 [Strongyloides ratti]
MVDNDDVDVYISKIHSNKMENKNEKQEEEDTSSITAQEQLQNLYLENSSVKTTFTDPSTSSVTYSPRRQNIFKEIYLANKRRFSLPGKHLSNKDIHNTIEHLPNNISSVSKHYLKSTAETGSFDNIPSSTDNGTTTFLEQEHHQPSSQNNQSKNFLRRYSLSYLMNGNFHRSDSNNDTGSQNSFKTSTNNGKTIRRVSVIEVETNNKKEKEKFHYAGLKLKDKQKLQSGYMKIHRRNLYITFTLDRNKRKSKSLRIAKSSISPGPNSRHTYYYLPPSAQPFYSTSSKFADSIVYCTQKLADHIHTRFGSHTKDIQNIDKDKITETPQQQEVAIFMDEEETANNEFEFRPSSSKTSQQNSNGGNKEVKHAKTSSIANRSKSPSAFIEKLSNFARGKYRSSLNEKSSSANTLENKLRKDIIKEIQKCKESGSTRLDFNSASIESIPPVIGELYGQISELFLYKNKLSTLPSEIGHLTNLKILGLSENNLTSLPDTLSQLQKLETLDLRHNKFSENIPAVIYKIPSLEKLWLRYNHIKNVSKDIKNLINVRMIDLRNNNISELPSEIGCLSSMTICLLSSNHIKYLPEEIGNCSKLSQLDLQQNELRQLPTSIGNLNLLTRLAIRYNQLIELPETLKNCVKLEEFIVENNKLHSLPDGLLSSLPLLKTINVSRNMLSSFPQGGPNQFEAAVSISFEHNQISKIPFGIFSKATGLTKLNLKDNELSSLPLDFGTWTSLTELNISNNNLSTFPEDIDKLVNLEVLVISTNTLKRLPPQIGNLRKLRELDVEENELDSIPNELGYLTNLTKLWLQSNKLTSLPATIGNLQNLTEFRVGENMLTFIPKEIGHMGKLKSLYLNDNSYLHNLPFELALCSSLEIMSIERCPLSAIPHDIVEGGPSLVIQYLKTQGPYRAAMYLH